MINYIKVEKDHDDYNIIVSFSGRDEWDTMKFIIERSFVDSKELAEEYEDRRFRPDIIHKMFDEICEIGDMLHTD